MVLVGCRATTFQAEVATPYAIILCLVGTAMVFLIKPALWHGGSCCLWLLNCVSLTLMVICKVLPLPFIHALLLKSARALLLAIMSTDVHT